MTITKAAILSEVQDRSGRSTEVVDIDVELLAIMKEVSARVPGAMGKIDTITIAASGQSVAWPDDTIYIEAITDPNDKVLEKLSIRSLLALHEAASADAATITDYSIFENKVYVQPTPTAETVLNVYYRYEEDDIDSIGFDDCFKEALIEGVCHKIELGKGLLGEITPQTISHKTFFDEQVAILNLRYKE